MPKRKVKEEKVPKRLGKKEILLAPIAMGASLLLALVIIPHFAPPPQPTRICLKAHNVDTFNLYPTIQIIVDGKEKIMPAGMGKYLVKGKECLHIIHVDEAGSKVHIEYIRPIRLTVADFLKIYSNNSKTINVIDNSTGTPKSQIIQLNKYNIVYSYFSEKGEFTRVSDLSKFPPFTNNMVVRLQFISK
jgi:hypothetical protein